MVRLYDWIVKRDSSTRTLVKPYTENMTDVKSFPPTFLWSSNSEKVMRKIGV